MELTILLQKVLKDIDNLKNTSLVKKFVRILYSLNYFFV